MDLQSRGLVQGFSPYWREMAAVETPICMHSATIWALNSGLRLFLRLRGETLSSSVLTTPLLLSGVENTSQTESKQYDFIGRLPL